MYARRVFERLLGVCAVGCCVAGLVACSSSASTHGSSASVSTPASSSGAATSSGSATPAPLSELKKIVLQPADLPAGWKGTPYHPDPRDAADQAAMVSCVGARNTDSDKVAEAHSEDFALGDADISSSASSYRSQSDLDTDVAILHSPKLPACYDQLVKKELGGSLSAGATIDSASIKIMPGSAGGPANVVATGTGTVKVTVSGQQVPLYVTVAFITGPLIQAEVDAENPGTPVPASVVNALVATVATRAAKG
jgi:hypothetical protein